MSSLKIEHIEVGRHVKVHCGDFKLDIHASAGGVGVWAGGKGMEGGDDTIGLFAGTSGTYFMIYPPKGYCQGIKLPLAIGTKLLQIPSPNGDVFTFTLDEVARLAAMARSLLGAS